MNPRIAGFRLTALVAGTLAVVGVLLAGVIVVLAPVLAPAVPLLSVDDFRPFNVVVAIGFPAVGFAIVRRQPGNLIGWLFIAGGVGNGLRGAGLSCVTSGIELPHGALPGADALAALVAPAWIPLPAAFAFTLALFPDGRPLTPRWRPVLWLMGAGSRSGWPRDHGSGRASHPSQSRRNL